MPTYQFEAMDASGQEIKDVIDATSEEEAQATIRQMDTSSRRSLPRRGRRQRQRQVVLRNRRRVAAWCWGVLRAPI